MGNPNSYSGQQFSQTLLKQLDHFLKTTSAGRLNSNLRKIILLSILRQRDNLPVFWFELIDDLYSLSCLLDIAAQEQQENSEYLQHPNNL